MSVIISPKLKTYLAEQFIESVSEPSSSSLYLTIGKSDAWANESEPDTALVCVDEITRYWRNMIGGKRILGSDIRHVIPRNDWAVNTVYDQWDSSKHNNQGLANANFYVVTSNFDVYKCIYNNESANSTVEPTTISTSLVSTEDGYLWKYMYSIPEYEQFYYVTANYIPVRTLTIDNNSDQWDVQEAAVDGAIYAIDITNPGSGYTNANTITVGIGGDGSGATANATINATSNTIETITLDAYGTGYHYANVEIIDTGEGTGATANALIGPYGGHGHDPLYELAGGHIMVSTRLSPLVQSALTTNTEFRQVGIVKDPLVYGTSNVASNTVVNQLMVLTITGNAFEYDTGEWVYQGPNVDTGSFSGLVVEWDSANSYLKLAKTEGTPQAATITGANSATSGFVSSIDYPDIQPYSGDVIYLNNIVALERDPDQIEEFKIVFALT